MRNTHTLIKHLTEKVERLEEEVRKLSKEKKILKEIVDYYQNKTLH